jgi:hypothetical protein
MDEDLIRGDAVRLGVRERAVIEALPISIDRRGTV